MPVIADANSMTYVLHRALGDDIVITRGGRHGAAAAGGGAARQHLPGRAADVGGQLPAAVSRAGGLSVPAGRRAAASARDAVAASIENALARFRRRRHGHGGAAGASSTGWRTRICRRFRRSAAWGCCSARSGSPRCCCATCSSGGASWRCSARSAIGARTSRDDRGRERAAACGRLLTGAVCAGLAIAPAVAERGGRVPLTSGGVLLLFAVFVTGLLSSVVAMRAATRGAAAVITPIGVVSYDHALSIVVRRQSFSWRRPLSADNWPQWRGPQLNGLSGETNLPVKWSKTENIAWKLPVPERSGATPIVWGDHIFLNIGEGSSLALWSVEPEHGRRPVEAAARRRQRPHAEAADVVPSPVTDGRTVWVMTGTGLLRAFDFAGKELWLRDIQKDYGRFGIQWGYASSPLLHEDVAVRAGAARDAHRRSVVPAADRQGVWQDALARGAADQRAPGVARRLHDARSAPLQGHDRDRHHRRRRRHRARSGDRQGAVARRRPQPEQRRQLPRRGVAARPRRDDRRAVTRAAAARAPGRGARRRHQVARGVAVQPGARRAVAGVGRHVSLLDQRPRHHVLPRSEDGRAPSTVRSGCGPPPTAARPCWPTARSTSRTRTA